MKRASEPPLHLNDEIEDRARKDAGYAIAYALLQVAAQQRRTADAPHRLGLADAATPMGALKVISGEMKETREVMSDAIGSGLNNISMALEALTTALAAGTGSRPKV